MTDENDGNMRAVKLDVLNKEHQSLVAAGQQLHRTLLLELVLSLLVLAFCFGWVRVGSQLSFGGLTVSVSQADLLLGAAFAVTLLFWRIGVLGVYGKRVHRHIEALYDELGYSEHTDSTGFSGFVYPDLLTTMSAQQQKVASFVLEIIRERPPKRGLRRRLAAACWFLTLALSLLIYTLVLALPLVVNGLVAVFARQHGINGFVGIAVIVVLLMLYSVGVWMTLQTFDRQEFARTMSEPMAAVQEFVDYLQVEETTPVEGVTPLPGDNVHAEAEQPGSAFDGRTPSQRTESGY